MERTSSAVLPIWNALRDRFAATAAALPEQSLDGSIGQTAIRGLLAHTAEVEYMFADWFFGRPKPELPQPDGTASLADLLRLLDASNEHLKAAMEVLPEERWHVPADSPMGASTPLEAVGRLMYHTGIHAGQIALIRKHGGNG